MGGKFGVNIFLLIGCWFMSESVNLRTNLKRIKKIMLETVFYGIVMGIADLIVYKDMFSVSDVLLCFKYWYTFAYITMLVIIVFADKLRKISYVYTGLCSILFVIVTIYGVIYPNDNTFWIFDKAVFIGPLFFTYVYLIVKQFKPFILQFMPKVKPIYFLITFGVLYSLMFIIHIFTRSSSIRAMYSPLCLGAAIFIFLFFASIKMEYNSKINKLGAVTYGTYLIHTNNKFNMMESLKGMFTNAMYSPFYIIVCVLFVISIFVLAIVLNKIYGYIRNRLLK